MLLCVCNRIMLLGLLLCLSGSYCIIFVFGAAEINKTVEIKETAPLIVQV